MKKLWLVLTLFAAVLLAADEVLCIPALVVNGTDQLQYVPANRGLSFVRVSEVEYGQPFAINFFLFLEKQVKEKTPVYGSLIIKEPSGKVVEALKDHLFFELQEQNFGVVAANSFLSVIFENSDFPGKYEYIFTLQHPQQGEMSVTAAVELKKSIVDNKVMERKEFSSFMTTYYREPKPSRLLAAWNFYINEGITIQQAVEKDNFNPMANLTGFYELFKLNPQFHDELAAASSKVVPEKQVYYAVLFAGLGKEFLEKYRSQIDPEIRQAVQRISDDPFAIETVTAGYHLDMLWMKFFITGAFEPVKTITSQLQHREIITVDEVRKRNAENKPLNAEEKKLFMNFVIQSAAIWSLRSNTGKDHQLLIYYLESILEKKLYGDQQEAVLIAKILEKIGGNK